MAFADANRASIRVIEESTWGTTPETGKSREVRLTSSALSASKETITSDELRADRMVSGITEVSAASGGDINFEFSAGAQDEFLAAFLMGAWSRPMTRDYWVGNTISVTGISEVTVAGQDITPYLTVGHRIKLVGFPTAGNNDYFEISAIAFSAGSTVITVTATDLTVEVGTADTRLFDANDVIVLRNTDISATATGFSSGATNAFAAAIAAGQLVVGQNIYVDGLAVTGGVYKIASLTDDTITTVPAPSEVEAAGPEVSIKGSMVRNPGNLESIVQRKFTVETAYNDIEQYMVQDGMVPGTFSLDISSGAIITGTIGFQGRETKLLQSTVLGDAGTYDVLATHPGEVYNATVNVGDLVKDGVTLAASIQSLSLSGESNLRQQTAVGYKFARGIGSGRFNLTGSMNIYFEDENIFTDFLQHNTVSLSFSVTDQEGQLYIFTIPSMKFSSDAISPGGIDQDVMEGIEFVSFRDPTSACMLQVDRFSPV